VFEVVTDVELAALQSLGSPTNTPKPVTNKP